jgi:glycosyltransferase involved in cell wall biosynthesis
MFAMSALFEKKRLLFVSPTRPAMSGHGTSMRAACILSALSQEYEISLLIVDLYRQRQFHCAVDGAKQWCSDVKVVDPANLLSPLPYESERFDVVFVLRLACMIFAKPYLLACHQRSVHILDMDDYESRTHVQFARLAFLRGDAERARRELQVAGHCSKLEDAAVDAFDYISLSNDSDRSALAHFYCCDRFVWLPNMIAAAASGRKTIDETMFTLLFVGTMDYFPNADGIHHFCAQVLPLLRKKIAPMKCRVLVVGCRPPESVRELGGDEQIVVTGEVESVADFYGMAHLAIVPLRAGGGTRIKILEAFQQQVPVVSTSAGCEGLEVRDGVQLAIADSAEAFAKRCCDLLLDPSLRHGLASRALEWVQANHPLSRSQSLISTLRLQFENHAHSPAGEIPHISPQRQPTLVSAGFCKTVVTPSSR